MTDEQKEGRKAKRGFAAMGAESQREIAAQGGRAAHRLGKAHRFDSQEGREAAAKRHAARTSQQAAGADGEAPAAVPAAAAEGDEKS